LEDELFVFKDKNIYDSADVFAHLQNMEIINRNAFLLRSQRESF